MFILLLGMLFASDCGTINYVRGEVHVMRVKAGEEGKSNPIRNAIRVSKAPFAIHCYDGLRTGPSSRLKVDILKGALSLGPNSQVLVESFVRQNNDVETLNMLYGKIRAVIDSEKNKNQTFKIKTPTSVAGVRGTDFYVEFDPNQKTTKQATLTGSVEVEQRGTEQRVLVGAGKQVEVQRVEVSNVKVAPRKEINQGVVAKTLPAKQIIEEKPVFVNPKPLIVTEIKEIVKEQIRSTSVIVKNDKSFTSESAVKILGDPEKWVPTKDEVPLDFRDIENVF